MDIKFQEMFKKAHAQEAEIDILLSDNEKKLEELKNIVNKRLQSFVDADIAMASFKSWFEGFKASEQIHCKHDNTIDIGDEEHVAVACTDCEKVLEHNN